MLETPHSIVGGAVGAATGNPAGAFAAGIGSHFLGDVMPHWNPEFPVRSRGWYAVAIADFFVAEGLAIAFWFLFPDRPEIAIGAFAGTIPDIILGIRFTFKVRWLRAYERFHGLLHWEVPLKYGLWPQLVVSVLGAWYLMAL
ncbi:MAG: hypothetical protein WD926_01110 [Patescibacteria group bacterium]